MIVNFHIEKLTLEGGSRADGARLGEALRSRLAELTAGGLRAEPGSIERLDAGIIPHAASPEHTGHHLAERIFGSVKGPRNA